MDIATISTESGQEHFGTTCKSREFLFHKSTYEFMKSVLPSAVP